MISPRQALSQLEQAILGVRRDEDRLTTMLRSAAEETTRLRARQAEAYKALARLRLDALRANQVSGALDAAERDALAAIEKGKAALAEIATRRAVLVDGIAAGEKTLDAHSERVEQAIDAVEALTDKTRARLADDPAWKAARDRVADIEAKAKAAAEKADQAEKDLAEKRKPYDADPLFTYLWQRGYGTSAYRAGPIARFFDARVARLVDYDPARANFYMLTEIPVRLRDHATRLNAAIAAAKSALVAFERKALEADGVAALEAAAAAADNAAQGRCGQARRQEGRTRRTRHGAGRAPRPVGRRLGRPGRSPGSPRRSPARTSPRSTARHWRHRHPRTSGSSRRSRRSSRRCGAARPRPRRSGGPRPNSPASAPNSSSRGKPSAAKAMTTRADASRTGRTSATSSAA